MCSDALSNDILKRFIRPAFQKLPLSYCVSTTDLYAAICSVRYEMTPPDSEEYEKLSMELGTPEATEKCSKHLGRIIDKVAVKVEEDYNKKTGELKVYKLFRTTVFSKELHKIMVEEYNFMAEQLGLISFPESYARILYDRSLSSMSNSNQDETVSAFYAFTEAVLLACLCLSLNKSAVDVLNSSNNRPKDTGRTEARFKRIKNTLFSNEFRRAVVAMFFDLVADLNEKPFQETAEMHLRYFWLPPKYRKTTYLGYACKNYLYRQYDVEQKRYSAEGLHQYVQERETLDCMEQFFGRICPVAEAMVLGAIPMDLIDGNKLQIREIDTDESDENLVLIDARKVPVRVCSSVKDSVAKSDIIRSYVIGSEGCEELDLIEYILKSEMLSDEVKEYFRSKGSYVVLKNEYVAARRVAEVIGTYIDFVIKHIARLLACLRESEWVSTKPFLEFFDEL